MVNVFANGFEVDENRVRGIVENVISSHGISGRWEVNVNFITKAEMFGLYDKKPHDVLSFPLEKEVGPDEVMRLGDIVVLGDLPVSRQDELIAHTCLHLLGIHHQ